ncbi:MAG TPA: GH92 family glycosyl hydrolase [bacterium]|nr:GH92 family glycosyl hydrolase [bacterium]
MEGSRRVRGWLPFILTARLKGGYEDLKRFLPAFPFLLFLVTTALSWSSASADKGPADPASWVNPFVGTANGGGTFPGAVAPWGLVSVSPTNDPQAPSGYVSGRPRIFGFGHLHLSGPSEPALGNVVLMPMTGPVKPGAADRASAYGSEQASPGYYGVRLTDWGVTAEMTAALRSGFSRYVFPARAGDADILVDASARLADGRAPKGPWGGSWVRVVSDREVEGASAAGAPGGPVGYFTARFSKACEQSGTWKDGRLSADPQQQGAEVGAFLRFSTAEGEPIDVKVGVSFVDLAGARANLAGELPDWDFEQAVRRARLAWDRQLSRITAEGGEDGARQVFYTALYHCLLDPPVFSDLDGRYRGFDGSGIQTARGYTRHSFFDLDASRRCLNPLLALAYPGVELDLDKSLVEMGKEGRRLPRAEAAGVETGEGVGAPAAVVLADDWLKGLTGFDVPAAVTEVQKALGPDADGPYVHARDFLRLGYVPRDAADGSPAPWGSVSATLAYAQAYWALGRWAGALGLDGLSKDSLARAGAYAEVFDPKTHFPRPRLREGPFVEPFDPQAGCCDQPWPGSGGPGFYRGTAWQNRFDVPQDLEGLKRLLGGDAGFAAQLEQLLDGQFDPGNPADFEAPYLFDDLPGREGEAQDWVRRLMARDFGPNADGLPGRDRGGSLSAWYVFSAMGFYPACPATPDYWLGSPLFQKVDVEVDKAFYAGDDLVVKTLDNSPRHPRVQSFAVNGLPQKALRVTHDQLTRGGVLSLCLGPDPAAGP